MMRQYGPANYDPDEVKTWEGISRSIDEYIAYRGYYPYPLPEGYRIPPELMRREYTSDILLQEAVAAINQQIEEVTEAVNMGVDAAVETMNEGVDAAMEGANEALTAGAEELTDVVNDTFETVMDTKHGSRNEDAQADREEEVYSTYHGKLTEAKEREVTGPVSAVNKAIDNALEEDPEEPGMLEVLGNASWRVGNGLTAWAEQIQNGHYSTDTHGGESVGVKLAETLHEDMEGDRREGAVYSTRHAIPVADIQEDMLAAQSALAPDSTGGMQDAFVRSSPRQIYQLEAYQQMAEQEKSMPKAKTPEEIAKIQEQRFQMSLELIQNIDFGYLFQRDFGVSMGG